MGSRAQTDTLEEMATQSKAQENTTNDQLTAAKLKNTNAMKCYMQ